MHYKKVFTYYVSVSIMAGESNEEKYFQLVIVRHGETEYNRLHIIQGQTNIHLSDVGLKQADLVAARLARWEESGTGFDLIFSSDLSRAKQTAEAIVSRLKRKKNIVTDELLRERAYGDYEERAVTDLVEEAKKVGLRPNEFTPRGGETLPQLIARAKDFFSYLLAQCSPLLRDSLSPASDGQLLGDEECVRLDGSQQVSPPVVRVLVVSHGGWIRSLLEHLLKVCPKVVYPKGRLGFSPNTGVTSLLVGVKSTKAPIVDGQDLVCTSVMSLCMNDGSHL